MPQMVCGLPQLEHGSEGAADAHGRPQNRSGGVRRHGQRSGKRGELQLWPLFVIAEESRVKTGAG